MSAGAVLEQFTNLLNRMESLGPKLSSNIRPSRDQLRAFEELRTRLKAATTEIESHVEILMQKIASKADDKSLASQIRLSKTADPSNPSPAGMLKKNLVRIYLGPDEDAADATKVGARKTKSRTRCEILRAQPSHFILMWAMALQPSKWVHSTIMSDGSFNFLVEELKTDRFSQIPAHISEILRCLKDEEPLKASESFRAFVESITRPVTPNEQTSLVRYKRKRADERLSVHSESHIMGRDDDKQMIERRSNEIDYKMSSMPINKLPHFIDRLSAAIESSEQWRWERKIYSENKERFGGSDSDRTDCLHFFVPKDRSRDISINLVVGRDAGLDLIYGAEVEIIRV